MASATVALRGLTKGYVEGRRRRVVLDGLDLMLTGGEFVALMGRSGSGKSTLLNLIAGIDLPDAGEIDVEGRRLDGLDERGRTLFRRRRIGFVYQFFNLIPLLSVRENIALPLALEGGRAAAREARVDELLAQVGLVDRADSYPDRLSGGEQQRVAIARGLVTAPAILLADEPTGNLDAETGEQVLGLFSTLVRGRGQTVLMVTHSREAARHADRVLELRDGRCTPAP